MRIGVHLSIGSGLKRTAEVAVQVGCEAIQIFSGNPNSWHTAPLSTESATEFVSQLREHEIGPLVLHTPYLVNLAALDADILSRSALTVRAARERATLLNARYIVTHVGSHKGAGVEAGVSTVVASISAILGGEEGESVLLLENSNGSGNSLGRSIEELGAIMRELSEFRDQVGVCLDTAHLWAAGHDISSPAKLSDLLAEFDRQIGLDRLHVIHANDCSTALGSHRDIHQAPGRGNIGIGAFELLFEHPLLRDKVMILEMPRVSDLEVEANLQEVKRLRSVQD